MRNEKNMHDIITFGDIKLDTFVVLDDSSSVQCNLKFPGCLLCVEYGAKIPVKVVGTEIAGTASNAAIGLRRLGFKTGIVSNMGVDGTRLMALKRLEEEGVTTKFIHAARSEQSSYSVVLNFKGEKTILTSHIRHAYTFPRSINHTKWLFIGELGYGYSTLFRSLISHAKKRGCSILFNPGTIQIKEHLPILFDLIAQTTILIVNREEAREIVESTSFEIHHLAPALYKRGAKQVVITDGANGSYYFDGKKIMHCGTAPGNIVEATGAGDAFATGFLGAVMKNIPPETALKWGSVNASSVIEKIGPTAGLLSKRGLEKRLAKSRLKIEKT